MIRAPRARHATALTAATAVSFVFAILAAARGVMAAAEFPIRAAGPPSFAVDAVSSSAGPDSSRVEVFWEIPRESLVFRGEGQECRATYDLSIVFYQKERQITGDIWSKRVRCRDLPTSAGTAARGRETFRLARGDYEVEVTLTIPVTRRRTIARARLQLTEGVGSVEMSDIELLRRTPSGTVGNPRHEMARADTGHVARIILRAGEPPPREFRVRWSIHDAHGARVAVHDSTRAVAPEIVLDLPLPVEDLEPGSYRLDIEALDDTGAARTRRRTDLSIRVTMEWLVANRREAALLLEILGAGDEAGAMRKAGGEEWVRILEEFWDVHDPSPGTDVNEYRDETFARMENANAAFEEPLRKPGWATDRGRIYMRYGRPETRVVRESDFNGPAAEIWEYFNPRRTFFFVDDRGIGEYVLSNGRR